MAFIVKETECWTADIKRRTRVDLIGRRNVALVFFFSLNGRFRTRKEYGANTRTETDRHVGSLQTVASLLPF